MARWRDPRYSKAKTGAKGQSMVIWLFLQIHFPQAKHILFIWYLKASSVQFRESCRFQTGKLGKIQNLRNNFVLYFRQHQQSALSLVRCPSEIFLNTEIKYSSLVKKKKHFGIETIYSSSSVNIFALGWILFPHTIYACDNCIPFSLPLVLSLYHSPQTYAISTVIITLLYR